LTGLSLLAFPGAALAQTQFIADLRGENVVPEVETEASGVALMTLSEDETMLRWELHGFDIENVTGAHIHLGDADENGEVLYPLVDGPFANPATGAISIDPEDVGDLMTGGTYVQVHTKQNPPGEIRGQILEGAFDSEVSVAAQRLRPQKEVPPITDLDARGVSTVAFDVVRNDEGNVLAGRVHFLVGYQFDEAVTFVGMHIHDGGADENGPVVIGSGLESKEDPDGVGTLNFVAPATSAEHLEAIAAVLEQPNQYYLNLHTNEFRAGALRAQVGNLRTRLAPRPGEGDGGREVPGNGEEGRSSGSGHGAGSSAVVPPASNLPGKGRWRGGGRAPGAH
jgi:hypothetical protein